ncbi:hypothetical protein AVEN_112477-1 [Araneus ventricosus]|uniref:Uncharacterized protein n=1 Tax=Araneus ventricosus TaxID=182803 RepID=A0A4Y2VGF4_ARAVE|nr:hypothetical protein AVEN_112477-1 [Araneus ventricosus]
MQTRNENKMLIEEMNRNIEFINTRSFAMVISQPVPQTTSKVARKHILILNPKDTERDDFDKNKKAINTALTTRSPLVTVRGTSEVNGGAMRIETSNNTDTNSLKAFVVK